MVALFVAIGLALSVYINSYINKQKVSVNSKAAAPESQLFRECGTKGKSCCADNGCNDGLRCGSGQRCVTASCGGEFEPCCGTVFTKDRCDNANVYSCRFSNIDDQICGSDPSRDEKYIATPPIQTVCGNVEAWGDKPYCAKESGMTAINTVSVVPAYESGKKEPYAHIMNFEAVMIPVSEIYWLYIDCDNDNNYEKTLFVEAKNERGTSYVEDFSKTSISREINAPLHIPFSCSYPLNNYIQPPVSRTTLLSGMDFDLTLPRSIKVNMFTKTNLVRSNSSDPINYFTSHELNEQQIRYWRNPTKYPINP